MKRILSVLFLLMFLASSCNYATNDSGQNTITYENVPVTPKMIAELGGVNNLKQYQFFLSEGLRLSCVNNAKSEGGEGSVNSRDDLYEFVFDAGTPGVFNTYRRVPLGKRITIFFDEGPEDYLEFLSSDDDDDDYDDDDDDPFYLDRSRAMHSLYRGLLLNSSSRPYVVVKMKKEAFHHKETAKGRVLE